MDPNATLTSLQLLYDIAETYGLDQKDVEKLDKAIVKLEASGPPYVDIQERVWVRRQGAHTWSKGWVVDERDPYKTSHGGLCPNRQYLVDFSGGPRPNHVPEEETGFCEWFDTAYGQVKPCGYQYSTNINYDPIAKEVSKFFESYEYY